MSANNPTGTAGALSIFTFESNAVRVVIVDGAPWFVAADVCRVLDHSDTSKAVSRLDDDERGASIVRTPSGDQTMLIISESGLYSLILTSRKESARRLKKWVTADVLPTIRKTGGYMAPQHVIPTTLSAALRLAADQAETIEQQAAALALAAPKVAVYDRLDASVGSMSLTLAAKTLGQNRDKLVAWMLENGWLYRTRGRLTAYQDRIDAGLMEHKASAYTAGDEDRVASQPMVTPKGLTLLAKRLGVLPLV